MIPTLKVINIFIIQIFDGKFHQLMLSYHRQLSPEHEASTLHPAEQMNPSLNSL